MAFERNMYSADEAMELILQSNADDNEFTESKAETDSEFEDEDENMQGAVIGDGGADFDIIVGYQPQQQHLLAETEEEYVDNSQQLVSDIHREEEANIDNFTAVNYYEI